MGLDFLKYLTVIILKCWLSQIGCGYFTDIIFAVATVKEWQGLTIKDVLSIKTAEK